MIRTQSLMNEFTRIIEEGNGLTSPALDFLLYRSDMLYQHAVHLSPLDDRSCVYKDIICKLREAFTIIRDKDPTIENSSNFRPGQYYSGNAGRPKFLVSLEQIGVPHSKWI